MGEILISTFPKITLTIYVITILITTIWHRFTVLDRRTYWFTFLKATEIGAVLALLEMASRWYWCARTGGEGIFSAIALAVVGALICVVLYGVFIAACLVLFIGARKSYRYCLTKPSINIKAWVRRRLVKNWLTADQIVDKGFWRTFFD